MISIEFQRGYEACLDEVNKTLNECIARYNGAKSVKDTILAFNDVITRINAMAVEAKEEFEMDKYVQELQAQLAPFGIKVHVLGGVR